MNINTPEPEYVERVLVQESTVRNSSASPNGWVPGTVTSGPNVVAFLDRNADNEPDVPLPSANASGHFDISLDLGLEPSQYANAAVVQLFFWCNWMHDKLYGYGFTEAAGNYQGNDPIIAQAQYGADANPPSQNNAQFVPAPNGTSGRVRMFLWTGPRPDRDGCLDAEIILHEYTHGLSHRLVGGGASDNLAARQSKGLGEGWSDLYALAVLSQLGDDVNGNYAVAAYSTYLWHSSVPENYYFSNRRYPYSRRLSRNPLTFKDIDEQKAVAHAGVPISGFWGSFSAGFLAGTPHRDGEVWCATLWDARGNFIEKHGFTPGNDLFLQVVTDGMRTLPSNPRFLQARDQILAADLNGANLKPLWTAFYKRGFGSSAVDLTNPDNINAISVVVEAFNEGDFNLDGWHDIVFQNGGSLAAWFMNGQTMVGSSMISPSTDASWVVKACAEITRDGKADLVFQHTDGFIARWHMNETTMVDSLGFFPSHPGDSSWRIAGVGDFDRDTKMDLMWQHNDGTLAVWYMDIDSALGESAGNVSMRSSALLNPSHPGDSRWRVVGTGDFDRDGKTDLLFQFSNPGLGGDGDLAVWHMDGINLKSGGANMLNPSNPGDPRWRVVATEDFNRDGYTDLIFQYKNPNGGGDGDLAVWLMNDYTLSSSAYLSPVNPGPGWNVVAPK